MKYKIIASDYDNTLYHRGNEISERTKKALRRFTDRGGIFLLCSGRTTDSLKVQIEKLGFADKDMILIGSNGAHVITSLSKQTLLCEKIKRDEMRAFALECEKFECYFHVYTEEGLKVSEVNNINKKYCEATSISMDVVGKLSEYLSGDVDCIKALIAAEREQMLWFYDYFQDKYPHIQVFPSSDRFLDAVSDKAGKGNALNKVASMLGVKKQEIIAFGDNYNDVPLLKAAGYAVAVNNAEPTVKEIADEVTDNCADDGVAKVIERLLENDD